MDGDTIDKDPDALLDYTHNWGSWLAAVGDGLDAISTFSVEITPVGELALDVAATLIASPLGTPTSGRAESAILTWLEGGVAGTTYGVRCRITTDQGRTDDRTLNVVVKQR